MFDSVGKWYFMCENGGISVLNIHHGYQLGSVRVYQNIHADNDAAEALIRKITEKHEINTSEGYAGNTGLTEMVFILDRSGSMANLVSDTIGGYNSLIEKQKKEPGEAAVTTVLFDDQYDVVCDNTDIQKVEPMTDKVYFARGMTALLDAIGKTIHTVAARQKTAVDSAIPAKTVVVIMTDGMENASKEYSYKAIQELIERQQKESGWEFLFMGANIDAIGTAAKMGISANRAANYHADSVGTARNFASVSKTFSAVRGEGVVPDSWKDDIDEDYHGRNKR